MPAARMPPFGTIAALSLLAGVGSCLALAQLPAWPLSGVALAAGALTWIRGDRLRWLGALLAGFGLAGLHAHHAMSIRLPAEPGRVEAIVSGRVDDLPRTEPRRIVFHLRIDADAEKGLAGRLVRVAWYREARHPAPVPRAGEHWRLPLRLRAPRGLRNPGGLDAEKHALADRLTAMAYVHGAGARRLAGPGGLDAWRERASARVASEIAGPSSRFIRALALGDTRFLDDADWGVLRANGLTHLIAISGFHVGMVAGACALLARATWWLLPWLGRRVPARIVAAGAGVVGAAVYAAAAGFSLPTVRTLLMIATVALAQAARRYVGVPRTLALAAIVVLLVDPLSVLAAGFWLSFVGVAWLCWCLPRVGASPVRELVQAQGVATVGLLPLTVLLFGQASLAGPFANLLAVPLWSLVVAPLSVFGLVLDAIHPALGGHAWRLANACFDFAWPLFEWLASMPLALVWLPEAHWLAVALALVGAFWLLLPRGVPGKPLALVLWLPLLWPDEHRPGEREVEITAIDVGQGLSVLVRTRGHALLYDMGPAVPDGFDAGERAVVPALHARGTHRLDRLIVSHGDLDHAGGLEAVRRAIPAVDLLAPDGAGIENAAGCVAGQQWTWDGVRFRVLHPPRFFPYLGNEASCVLRIESVHGAALLTGDIGDVIERRLVDATPGDVRADLVIAAHHGSRHSSDPAFVAATRARHVVFSTGHGNRFRHPADVVVKRWTAAGARAWDTALHGAVTFRLAAGGIGASARRHEYPRLWDATQGPGGEGAGLSYRRD